jgi:hypothetical protein
MFFVVYLKVALIDDVFGADREYYGLASKPFTEPFAIPPVWWIASRLYRDMNLRRDPRILESCNVTGIEARWHSKFEHLSPDDQSGRRFYPRHARRLGAFKSN